MTVNHNVLPLSRVLVYSSSKTAFILSTYMEFQESVREKDISMYYRE